MKLLLTILFLISIAQAQIITNITWATGPLGQGGAVNTASQCAPPNDSSAITDSFIIGRAVRFQTNRDDALCPAGSTGKRQELSFFQSSASMTQGEWFFLKTMYPAWQPADPRPELIWQYHQRDTSISGTPLVSIWVENGIAKVSGAYTIGGTRNVIDYTLGPISPGKVDEWLLYYKRSITSTGITRIWRNGVLVYERYGANANELWGSIEPTGYFKWGLYKWVNAGPNPSTQGARVIYETSNKVGNATATFEDFYPPTPPAPSETGIKGKFKL